MVSRTTPRGKREVLNAAKILLNRRACRDHLGPFIRNAFKVVSPGDKYLHNYHIDMVGEHLEAVFKKEILRLIINMPPRYLKSISTTVSFPGWCLGKQPSIKIMAASYSHFLAFKHSQDTRLLIESEWYQSLFPKTILRYGQIEKRKFETTAKGHRIATSVGGTTTGEGGEILIVDDPIDPEQSYSEAERLKANRWYDQTFSTRLDKKKTGAVIIVMQRLHQDDLCGHVLKNQGDWTVLKIPGESKKREIFYYKFVSDLNEVKRRKKIRGRNSLLHPRYEGRFEIEQAKKTLGTYGFSSQYQQDPSPAGGGIIHLNWFKRFKFPPTGNEVIKTSQFWDTAQKSNEVLHSPWVCGTFLSTYTAHYLVHVFREWMTYPEGKRQVKNLDSKWKPNIIVIENKSTGQSLLQELAGLPTLGFEPEGDKVTRLSTESPAVEAGNYYLPIEANWLFDFEEEIQLTPNSTYKDQGDMLSMALKYFRLNHISSLINIGGSKSQVI